MLKDRMSKRGIAVLIAGLVLGAQVGLATAAGQGYQGEPDEPWRVLPGQVQYLDHKSEADRAANQAAERDYSFSSDLSDEPFTVLPGEAAYLDGKSAAANAGGQAAARDYSIPGGPSDEPWTVLPRQATYFDNKSDSSADLARARIAR
jgi:hypothetical protein